APAIADEHGHLVEDLAVTGGHRLAGQGDDGRGAGGGGDAGPREGLVVLEVEDDGAGRAVVDVAGGGLPAAGSGRGGGGVKEDSALARARVKGALDDEGDARPWVVAVAAAAGPAGAAGHPGLESSRKIPRAIHPRWMHFLPMIEPKPVHLFTLTALLDGP